MAINKNFVIKNGIEVNDNVFVVDPNENIVGINTALPEHTFHVIGGIGVTDARITGITTALGDVLVADSTGEDGKAFAVRVSAGNSVGINTANPRYPLEIVGPASIGEVAEYVFGDLEVTGDITSANINAGSANFTGITTFTDTTENILGDADTGAVQIDGGLGVNKNVTIGAGLSVTGDSYFVGVVTFAAGASGTIQLGDNANDNVEFQADVNSNIIPNDTTPAFDLGSSSQQWKDLYLAGIATVGRLSVAGFSTFRDTVQITSLTDNRIAIVGAGSTIEDSADLTFDGNSLAVGTALTVTGISTFNNNVSITSLTDNRIAIVGAGSTIEDDTNLTFDGETLAVGAGVTFDSNDTTESTSATTGSAQFAGGVGIEKQLYVGAGASVGTGLTVGGVLDSNDTTESTSATTGSAQFAGGVGIEKQLYVGAGASVGAGLTVAGDLLPEADGTRDLGSSSVEWKDLYIDGTANIDTLSADTAKIGDLTDNRVVIAGSSGELEDDANLTFDGTTLSVGAALTVTGITTFTNSTDNTLGDTGTGAVKIAGGLAVAKNITASGITTFTDATDNTLGDTGTGAVRIAGGLAVAKNVTVGSGLSVTGTSYFVGEVTFAGGATGNDINLGSTNADNVVFVADVNSNIVPNTDDTYDLGSSSKQWKDLYVNGLAELDFVNVSAASTFAGDVSIADKIVHTGDTNTAIRFPAADTFTVETAGSERFRITAAGSVGINTDVGASVGLNLHQISGAAAQVRFQGSATGTGEVDGFGLGNSGTVDAYVWNYEAGHIQFATSNTERLRITSGGSVGIGSTIPVGKLDVVGHTELDTLNVAGVSTFVGIASFTNTTDNTLGDVDTGSVQFDGGLGIAGNVTVGGGLSVTGNSYFVGMVTFAAGTNGNITLGDNAGDNVVFNADVNSNFIPNTDNAYDLGSSSQQWKDLYVNGLSDLDFVNVSAASTFAGTIDANGRIVGAATSNVIPFLYANFSDLPSAATYHGAFAHVHATGKAYYAHANAWYELVNKNLAGVVGTGTEGYTVGVVTATQADIGDGGLDVDGHTELDGVNVSGATTTNILHVGTAGTVLSVSDQTSEFKIGSASNPVTATMNGGAIPSIGLVIALGG